MIEKLDFAGNY